MSVPRDFLAEVEAGLEPARRRLRESADDWAALEELRQRTLDVARALRRPISVFDLFASARDEPDRAHLAALVATLRSAGT